VEPAVQVEVMVVTLLHLQVVRMVAAVAVEQQIVAVQDMTPGPELKEQLESYGVILMQPRQL
jgi:hypothetical protein